MWKPADLRWRDLLRTTVRDFTRNGLDARSAQFAYYAFLLIPPTLILLINALTQLHAEGALDAIADGARQALPQGASDLIAAAVDEIRAKRSNSLIWLATGVFVGSACSIFISVGRGMNRAYGVEETRPAWAVWGLALVLGLMSFLLLVVNSALLVLGPVIDEHLTAHVDAPLLHFVLTNFSSVIVVVVAALFATSVVYWFMPNVKARWKLLTPGSVLAVGAWVVSTLAFRVYVDRFGTYNQTYGALAGVIVLMLWLYLTGLTFFFGAQLNAGIRAHRSNAASDSNS